MGPKILVVPEAKLMIQSGVVSRESLVKSRESLVVSSESVAESPQPSTFHPQPSTVNRQPSTVSSSGSKKNLLDALREKYGDKYSIEEVKESEELIIDKLQSCWDTYTTQLEQEQKHSSAATFKIAKLQIESDNRFTASVSALTAQRFIEQEKMGLTDYIHQQFNNRSITFSVLVTEGVKEEVPQHMTMNSKQKFERISEQYPLIKELKDRLKLELDY